VFKNLLDIATSVANVPLAVAADVVTFGGMVNDRDETHTGSAIRNLGDNVAKAIDDNAPGSRK